MYLSQSLIHRICTELTLLRYRIHSRTAFSCQRTPLHYIKISPSQMLIYRVNEPLVIRGFLWDIQYSVFQPLHTVHQLSACLGGITIEHLTSHHWFIRLFYLCCIYPSLHQYRLEYIISGMYNRRSGGGTGGEAGLIECEYWVWWGGYMRGTCAFDQCNIYCLLNQEIRWLLPTAYVVPGSASRLLLLLFPMIVLPRTY